MTVPRQTSDLRGTSDEGLVALMAEGDEAALRELYRRYAPFLLTMTQRMGLGEGALQPVEEAFARLWEGARRFDADKASVRTLLVTTCHRLAVHAWSPHRGTAAVEANLRVPAEERAEGDGEVYVSEALDRLDPLARDLLELAFFAGLDHRRLSEVSGRPPAVVKTTMRRALATLRDSVVTGSR